MALETLRTEALTLQDSPLATEQLLGAAAFGGRIDMAAFEAAYAAPSANARTAPSFNSLLEAEEPEAMFNSFIDGPDTLSV